MSFRDIKTNAYLQRILTYIVYHPLCTNMDVCIGTGSTRVASDVSEINQSFVSHNIKIQIDSISVNAPKGACKTAWRIPKKQVDRTIRFLEKTIEPKKKQVKKKSLTKS